ncbi:hypothetical protein [Flavihumibacter petaseus]|uniref:Uncharacterized protein n=1 Tax=Flavihumibacter petaseus NBRC 106054 TaxID=1220578 RepID=A0A0E9N800_9BACT|nr:hypothetical protein [Flavihumibacter petaseus]GAO45495.1 hypothetical protein FPE01S_05_01900 [Flavihumibacter petaseus NBRC 106054]
MKKKTTGKPQKIVDPDIASNADLEGVDKAPGEERGKAEKVTLNDLKGKQVDEDPESEEGKPLDTLHPEK